MTNEDNNTPPTFSQDDVDRIVGERLAREKGKLESLNTEKTDLQTKLLEYEANAAEATLTELKTRKVAEAGLPAEVAARVVGTTPEEIDADISDLAKILKTTVTIGGKTRPAETGTSAYTRDQVRGMSPEDIQANWKQIEKQLADGTL